MSSLSLGDLYRAMRGELAADGNYRVTINYQHRSSTAPVTEGRRTEAGIFSKQILNAEVECRDHGLSFASMSLLGMTPSPHPSFVIRHAADGFAYSFDEIAWGRFTDQPHIFDLLDFENELVEIPVGDVTVEQAIEARRLRESLEVDMNRTAFQQLLQIFNADSQPQEDDLELESHAVTIAGADDLALLYWWSLSGFENEPMGSELGAKNYAVKVTCNVSIRLSALRDEQVEPVLSGTSLPDVDHLDDIWKMLRHER